MAAPPIPQRIPPLMWRRPSWLWTPLALALALGLPAAVFMNDPALQRFALVAGALVFALALITLGASWALGRAPRTRRVVLLHVLGAGLAAALIAPFVLTALLAEVADYERPGAAQNFSFEMAAALTPLALALGLPIVLVSGIVFAFVALARQRPPRLDDALFRPHDVQPFR